MSKYLLEVIVRQMPEGPIDLSSGGEFLKRAPEVYKRSNLVLADKTTAEKLADIMIKLGKKHIIEVSE